MGRACPGQRAASCRSQTFFSEFKDSFNLFAAHARKPLDKIADTSSIFEIHKQRLYRDAGALENPRTTNDILVSFNFGALSPIQH
jgi:hypothetical protein